MTSTVSSTQDPRVVLGFELGGAVRERLVDASAGGAHEFAGGGLLVLGQSADLTVGEAQRGLFAGVREPHGLEFIKGGGGGNGGDGLVYGGGNGGFIQGIRDGGARQSFSHLLFLATSRVMPRRCRLRGFPAAHPSLAGHLRDHKGKRSARARPAGVTDGRYRLKSLRRAPSPSLIERLRPWPRHGTAASPASHGLMTCRTTAAADCQRAQRLDPAGSAAGRAARTPVSNGPRGLLIATGYRWRLPFAGAFTVGNVVLFRAGPARALANPALLGHEEQHSTQYAWCLGVPFLPLYFLAAGWSQLRTGNPGSANFFERHAGLQAGGYVDTGHQGRLPQRRPSGIEA